MPQSPRRLLCRTQTLEDGPNCCGNFWRMRNRREFSFVLFHQMPQEKSRLLDRMIKSEVPRRLRDRLSNSRCRQPPPQGGLTDDGTSNANQFQLAPASHRDDREWFPQTERSQTSLLSAFGSSTDIYGMPPTWRTLIVGRHQKHDFLFERQCEIPEHFPQQPLRHAFAVWIIF